MPAVGRCAVILEKKMKEVKEFKYLGTALCKQRKIEGETSVRAVIGRCVIGLLASIMRESNVTI